MDHGKHSPMEGNEKRNCMVEAARIAWKPVMDIEGLKAADYSALIIPGGFGAYTTLFQVDSVKKTMMGIIKDFIKAGKPIAAICIAPKMMSAIIEECEELQGKYELTVGTDVSHFEGHTKTAGKATSFDEVLHDKANNIFSTGAFMHGDEHIAEIAKAITEAVSLALQ